MHGHVGADLEAVLAQPREPLAVGLELESLDRTDSVAPDRQRPCGGELGVELADRAGGGVARVGEGRLTSGGARLVQLREVRARQVDLAAHLELGGSAGHPQGDRADGPEVLSHVLADLAVAARRAPDEHAVLVEQRDGQPVDLRLAHVVESLGVEAVLLGQGDDSLGPRPQLLLGARIGQRQHRLEVLDGLEALERPAAHALGRRVWSQELGVTLLEVAELVQQRVVVGVGDLRLVEDVVEVAVALEL